MKVTQIMTMLLLLILIVPSKDANLPLGNIRLKMKIPGSMIAGPVKFPLTELVSSVLRRTIAMSTKITIKLTAYG